jgi:hypothetical protein
MDNVEVSYMKAEARPAFVLNDVQGADFYRLRAQTAPGIPTFALIDVENFSVKQSHGVPDRELKRVKQGKL